MYDVGLLIKYGSTHRMTHLPNVPADNVPEIQDIIVQLLSEHCS